jgi:hypothetical protein
MGKFLALAAIAVAAAAAIAVFSTRSEANASTAGDPRIAVLQTQVKTLQTQVKLLTKALAALDGQLTVNFAGDTCLAAQTTDMFEGTWSVVDQLAQATQQKTYFGPQTQLNDYGNCAQLKDPLVPRGAVATPPSINTFQPLIQWLHE